MYVIKTARIRRMGKAMFSQVSLCPQRGTPSSVPGPVWGAPRTGLGVLL